MEKLLKKFYVDDDYNNEVRPFGPNDMTKVETELKLLQIDLDEKYQQLVSTVWIEMVKFNQNLVILYNY